MLQLWVNLEMIDKGCFKEGKSEKKITCYLPTSSLILMVFQKAYKEKVDGKKLSLYARMCLYRREQILVGRKTAVSHPISKFKDGARAGITFDRGIRIRMKPPFYQFV